MDIAIFIIGYIFGIVSAFLSIYIRMNAGVLRIDHSDPFDSPYMFLEISKNIEYITKKKYILLKVRAEDFIPRK